MALSFKTRLAVWHAVVTGIVLVIASLGSHALLSEAISRELDAHLLAMAETEAGIIAANPEQTVQVYEPHNSGVATPSSIKRLDQLVQIVDHEGLVLARSTNLGSARLPTSAGLPARVALGEPVFETLKFEHFGGEPVRIVSVPVRIAGGARYVVQVGESLDDIVIAARAARWLFLVMSLGILSATTIVGLVLTRKAFAPIDEIVRRTRQIGVWSLSERLPMPANDDEIARLTQTLNGMLDRIEQAVEMQKRFTADASHELRSPLSRLRAELEVALRRPREQTEYEDTLRSCLQEVERLSSLTEELLILARLDAARGQKPEKGAATLVTIVEEAMRRIETDASRRGVTVALGPSAEVAVKMTPSAARLLVSNLLDNAVKFSPPGGQVTVSISAAKSEAVLSVSDTGPGIPSDDIPFLFERFHRGSTSRASNTPGVGLGLAISRAVVEAHGGQISVQTSASDGTRFSVKLPVVRAGERTSGAD